jgi:hypothetical protein
VPVGVLVAMGMLRLLDWTGLRVYHYRLAASATAS